MNALTRVRQELLPFAYSAWSAVSSDLSMFILLGAIARGASSCQPHRSGEPPACRRAGHPARRTKWFDATVAETCTLSFRAAGCRPLRQAGRLTLQARAVPRSSLFSRIISSTLRPALFLVKSASCKPVRWAKPDSNFPSRSEEHTSELQSRLHLVCRLLLEKTKAQIAT